MNNFRKIIFSSTLLTVLYSAPVWGMDIFQAAATGNIGRIEELLTNGTGVNQQDNLGMAPLHYAAKSGHEQVVLRLIQADANVNQYGIFGKTPLHFAAEHGHQAVVLRLIEAGANGG